MFLYIIALFFTFLIGFGRVLIRNCHFLCKLQFWRHKQLKFSYKEMRLYIPSLVTVIEMSMLFVQKKLLPHSIWETNHLIWFVYGNCFYQPAQDSCQQVASLPRVWLENLQWYPSPYGRQTTSIGLFLDFTCDWNTMFCDTDSIKGLILHALSFHF